MLSSTQRVRSRQRFERKAATAIGIVATVTLQVRSSHAAGSSSASCSGPEVVVDGALTAPWRGALDILLAHLKQDVDLDRCARLVLTSIGDQISVRITASDGRRAERRVLGPEHLLTTVEALVILPPAAVAAPEARDSGVVTYQQIPPSRSSPSAERAQLDLGGGVAGRLTGAPGYGGAGLAGFAELTLDRWLVGVAARWEAFNDVLITPSPSGFNMQSFALGVGVGRRAVVGSASLDAMVGPEMVVENQEAEGPADGLGGNANDVRLDVLLRVSVPRPSKTRFFAAADLDASPSRLRRSRQLDNRLPNLPSWGAGLQLGLVWSAL